MSTIEQCLFKSSPKWFFLRRLIFDEYRKTVTIEIYPNDQKQEISSFVFKQVTNLVLNSDEDLLGNEFPKQIVGIDYYEQKKLYVINCGEIEYSFSANSFEEIS
jgi:hypothetical protein